ncbi:hypothetical protein GGR51DRAFT_544674 [Nemania sp. FL0031]|nr:hypothetical protein GGR51DRAFT_544674 [Nemania sp. FL0031]
MTYTIVAFIRRKKDTSPAQFRAHYDNVHVPLLQVLVGSNFPISHTRHYVTRYIEPLRLSSHHPVSDKKSRKDPSPASVSGASSELPVAQQDRHHDQSTTQSEEHIRDHGLGLWSADAGEELHNNASYLPVMYRGQPSDVDYDAITIMVWEDKGCFERFRDVFYREEVAARIFEDEKRFLDHGLRLTFAVEEPAVTRRMQGA